MELGGEETERARRWQQSRGGLPCTPCCSSPQLPTPRPNAGAGCVSPPGPRTAAPTEGKGARGPWGKEPEGPAETTTACRSRRPGPRARAGWAVTNVTGRKWEPELGTAPPGRTTRTRAAVAFGCHWAPARAAFPGPSRGLPDVGEAWAAPSSGLAEGSAPGRRCRPVKSCPPRPGSSKSRWHREVPQQSAKAADPAVGREAEAQAAAAGTCQGRLATRAPSPGAGLQRGARGVSGTACSKHLAPAGDLPATEPPANEANKPAPSCVGTSATCHWIGELGLAQPTPGSQAQGVVPIRPSPCWLLPQKPHP